MQVIKRDGSTVDFDKSKIREAICKSMKTFTLISCCKIEHGYGWWYPINNGTANVRIAMDW